MNINIKNCEVNINTDTETLEIKGKPQSVAPAAEDVISTQHTYSMAGFMANRNKVKIGDRIKLPAFTVPSVKMDGENVLEFDEKHINADEGIVIGKDENGDFILIFDHCLFESAIDLNDEKRFEMTQLGQYLQSEFLRSMNYAGIPAKSCSLISKKEMFDDYALEYFKTGRNRIAFDFDEDCSRHYWLSTLYTEVASSACFCLADGLGRSYYNRASGAYIFVRPRFVISAI